MSIPVGNQLVNTFNITGDYLRIICFEKINLLEVCAVIISDVVFCMYMYYRLIIQKFKCRVNPRVTITYISDMLHSQIYTRISIQM